LIALEVTIFFITANFGPFLALPIVGGEKELNYAKPWPEPEINSPGLNYLITSNCLKIEFKYYNRVNTGSTIQ